MRDCRKKLASMNHAVVAFNNNGVEYLEDGQFDEAMMCFKEALETLKALITEPESKPEGDVVFSSERSLDWSAIPSVCEEGITNPSSSCDDFIFSRALYIAPRPSSNEDPNYSVQEFAAVLYNFALTSHLCGLGSSVSRTSMLQKALSLYDMSCSLLEMDDRNSTCISVSFYVLVIAILNNQYQVQKELGLYDRAERTFAAMLKKWISIKEEVGGLAKFMDESDCNGLFLNLFMRRQNIDTAPAA